MEKKVSQDLDVGVFVDAVKVSGSGYLKEAFKQLPYRREYDYRLEGTPEENLYARVAGYITPAGTKIGVAYDPVKPFMPSCIFTISPAAGLWRRELDEQLKIIPNYRFTKIELAHVFRAGSVVTLPFARKHLIVGKSKRSDDPRYPDTLYFGSRTSPVFARCYTHPTNRSFKVEPEFHRQYLDKFGIRTTADFIKLAQLARKHVAFYRLDPIKASAAFARMDVPIDSTLRKVIARQHDIYKMLDFLRHDLGMVNALRIFTPLATNLRVKRALQKWAGQWASSRSVDEGRVRDGAAVERAAVGGK